MLYKEHQKESVFAGGKGALCCVALGAPFIQASFKPWPFFLHSIAETWTFGFMPTCFYAGMTPFISWILWPFPFLFPWYSKLPLGSLGPDCSCWAHLPPWSQHAAFPRALNPCIGSFSAITHARSLWLHLILCSYLIFVISVIPFHNISQHLLLHEKLILQVSALQVHKASLKLRICHAACQRCDNHQCLQLGLSSGLRV